MYLASQMAKRTAVEQRSAVDEALCLHETRTLGGGGGPWGWAKFNIAAVLTLSRNGGYQGTCGASAPQNKTHTHTHATSNA